MADPKVTGSTPSTPVWTGDVAEEYPDSSPLADDAVPPADDDDGGGSTAALFMPTIPAPKIGGLSLEMMVQAIGMNERNTLMQTGLDSIRAKAAEQEELNAKKLEEIQKNTETMKSKSTLSGFMKAFKILGAVLGLVASVATTAVGLASGNALLAGGGLVLLASSISGLLSTATDGKVSIGAGIALIAEKFGADEDLARKIGSWTEIGITVVGCAACLVGAFSAAGAKAAELAVKSGEIAQNVMKVVTVAQKISAVASGVTTAAQSVAAVVDAHYDKKMSLSRAAQKDFEALLERIQQAVAMEQDFLEVIMERTQKLAAEVTEIVKDNAQAQTAILADSSPSMA